MWLNAAYDGVRSLWRKPSQALPPIVLLAAGIGLTLTLLSVFNAFLFRPLPFDGADSWLSVELIEDGEPRGAVSPMVFSRWKREAETVELAVPYSMAMTFARFGHGGTEAYRSASVGADFFRLVGVAPVLGRAVQLEDEAVGAPEVVVLSYELWQRHFDGESSVIGNTASIGGSPVTVIGVMPEGFAFPLRQQLWTALRLDEMANVQEETLSAIIVPAQGAEASRQELEAMAQRLHREAQASDSLELSVSLEPFVSAQADARLKTAAQPILLAVLAVLFVACLNVSALLATRTVGKMRPLAIRSALGAQRSHLVGSVWAEAFVLSLLGVGLGIIVSIPAIGLANRLLERGNLWGGYWTVARLDPALVGLALAASLPLALIVSILPVLKALAVEPMAMLRAGSSGNSDAGKSRLADTLMIAETALTMILLVPAGLMTWSAWNLAQADLGFQVKDHQITGKISIMDPAPDRPPEVILDQVRQHLLSRSPADTVAFSSSVPMEGTFWAEMISDERPEPFSARWQIVSPEYFDILGIPVQEGRMFGPSDIQDTSPVAVVSRSFYDQFLDEEAVAGPNRIRWKQDSAPWLEVIGVVGDVQMDEKISNRSPATVYLPMLQHPRSSVALIASSARDPLREDDIRQAVAAADPTAGVFHIRPLAGLVAASRWLTGTLAWLLTVFAAITIGLTLSGLYALMSARTRHRFRELGIRLALGEKPNRLFVQTLSSGLWRVALGVLLGALGVLPVAQLLKSLVFGIEPLSPTNMLGVALALLFGGLLASLFQALRAARSDPRAILRED